MTTQTVTLAVMLGATTLGALPALAGNFGSDFDISMTPAAGGMAGVGLVRPQDPVAAAFGNPATMSQLQGETSFTLGGTYLDVTAKADHDGSITGAPFSASSESDSYLLPQTAALQRIGESLVVGGGITVNSGLGADFRNVSPIVRPKVEFLSFAANFGAAYDLTEDLTIGAAATLGFGLLELGLVDNTALKDAFGFRGSVGATYDLGPVAIGASYTSPLKYEFEGVTETSPGTFTDFDLTLPQMVGFGIATTDLFASDWLVEFNYRWKNWSNADGFEDVWQDQHIFALGGQYRMGDLAFRLGYSYSTDLQKKNVGNSIGSIGSLALGGGTVPVTPDLVQFVQATLTQPFWQQQISAGAGYQVTERLRLDVQGGYAFDGDRSIGGTDIEVNEFQVGAGFTWTF
ncbi:MAG: outer membrane protein transport protein [Thermohalobaculum sp.]|nr:outer membrane protein transport protein [Thermohalobaculum sp.]